jgi:hypothetical protein
MSSFGSGLLCQYLLANGLDTMAVRPKVTDTTEIQAPPSTIQRSPLCFLAMHFF